MNPGVLVYTHNPLLLDQIGHELGQQVPLFPCDSIPRLQQQLEQQPVKAVLVHMGRDTVDAGNTPGRFIAELNETVDAQPLYGLVDPDCPSRLRKLASRSADDCLTVPVDLPRLKGLLSDHLDPQSEIDEIWRNVPHKELHGATRSLVTFSPEMFGMLDEIQVAARHEVTALLIGETGSGKTYLARLIHELSERRGHRFHTVACGALPADLIDSELFGHKKGAFTGADADREGKFAATGRGTLLLDEIDVLAPDQQAKLLRVIETGEYEPVGSNDTKVSQARLIVASNYNLEDLVRVGSFRTDLYYRLNILSFRLPPLRERPMDIEYLARKFAIEHSKAHGIQLREIEPAFLETLRRYPWPGNIREMENVVRRAVLYSKRGVLSVDDLPSAIRLAASGAAPVAMPIMQGVLATHAVAQRPIHGHDRMVNVENPVPQYAATGGTPGYASGSYPGFPSGPITGATYGGYPAGASYGHPQAGGELPRMPYGADPRLAAPPAPAAAASTPPRQNTLEDKVDIMERRIIEDSLQRNNHRRKETAAELGISRVTLYNKMKKFGML